MLYKKLYTFMIATLAIAGLYAQGASVQIIHNAPDADLKTVDIYLDNTKIVDNMNFRTATKYSDVSSGTHIVSIAPSTSTSVLDAIVTKTVSLSAGQSYTVIAEGLKTPSKFASNPNGISTSAELFLLVGTKDKPGNPKYIKSNFYNGVSDAPELGFIIRNKGIAYAKYKSKTFINGIYDKPNIIDLIDAKNNGKYFGSFKFPFNLYDTTFTVIASGFIDSSKNNNYNSLKLYAVYGNGKVAMLGDTQNPVANYQFINASSDPKFKNVDIYFDSVKIADNIEYMKATKYNELKNGEHWIGVAFSNSSSYKDTIFSQRVVIKDFGYVVVILNGVDVTSNFAPNPSKISTKVNFNVRNYFRPYSDTTTTSDLEFFNAITDIDQSSIYYKSVDDASNQLHTSTFFYNNYSNKILRITDKNYKITVAENKSNGFVVAYSGDLGKISDSTGIVVASGFVNPSSNQNGVPVTMWLVNANGSVVNLSIATAINEQVSSKFSGISSIYPNPTNEMVNINVSSEVKYLRIISIDGKVVKSIENSSTGTVSFQTNEMVKGMYFISTNLGTSANKLIIK